MNNIEKLCDFIKNSPSCFHAAKNIREILLSEGFTELKEVDKWHLEKGGKYFVVRNNSSVVAFVIGKESDGIGYKIIASHSDSPTFKLKSDCELKDAHYLKLNVEGYGGMIHSTWFDKPLSIAGRCMVKEENTISMKLFNLDYDAMIIPNLAIHMNRQLNEGVKYSVQNDLAPLFEGEESTAGDVKKAIADSLGIEAENLLAVDGYLYNRMTPTIVGGKQEFVCSAKLDDLECAFGTLQGFIHGKDEHSINVYCCFDNEEVGSTTRQGANSNLLDGLLRRINGALGLTEEDYYRSLATSFMVSADNAHACHPSHPEKTDVVNKTFMNKGIVIKNNAAQSYATDGISASIFKAICDRANVPYQMFNNNSDVRGGGTLGNISTTHVSISTVDIGLAQLAMHSAYETAGAKDVDYLVDAITEYFSTTLKIDDQLITMNK